MDDFDQVAEHGGDGARVHPPTDTQRLRSTKTKAAKLARQGWDWLSRGETDINLLDALIIARRARSIDELPIERVDEAEALLAGIARVLDACSWAKRPKPPQAGRAVYLTTQKLPGPAIDRLSTSTEPRML